MREILTTGQMRALELNSEYFGISRTQLMENAGRCVAIEVASRFSPQRTRVIIYCGTGGNGGDGFVAARHLLCMGFRVEAVLAGKPQDITNRAARRNLAALEPLRNIVPIHQTHDSALIGEEKGEVLVDALLGIGLNGNLRPPILQLVKHINEMDGFRVSVDVPTGIDSDSGEVLGEAVKADVTVTFHKMKVGLTKAKEYTGKIVVKDIGLPLEFEQFIGPGDVQAIAKPRPAIAHKGDFGKLLVVGGSKIFSGAPALTALAALRTGADLAYVAAPKQTAQTISSMSPALVTVKLKGDHLNPGNLEVLRQYLDMSDALVLGPGLGLHEETKSAVEEITKLAEEMNIPMLLDADGLKAFADFQRELKIPLVLTPHAGEYKMLAGKPLCEQLDKQALEVRKIARKLGAVILLKGNVDIVSDGEHVRFSFTGNPGMTVGGTGDILSGVVGALLAQKVDALEAAAAGAFVNGAAGDFVAEEKGYHMIPSDLLEWIPRVFDDPMAHRQVRKSAL